MSIIFGFLKDAHESVVEEELRCLALRTDRFASDGSSIQANGQIGMGIQPYYTHQRSQLESGPLLDLEGNMLCFDGRLDNQTELCKKLNISSAEISDLAIVLRAFLSWGENSFSHLIGDWALALWSHRDRLLYLARDHAGTRTLYFENCGRRIYWSTYLETFFGASQRRELNHGYAACYLACRPIGDLTPYKGINAVTPGHYIMFRDGKAIRKPHWEWVARTQVRYKTDSDYEKHFFSLFRTSVERRTVPGAPILAQLSGGMDSSSIVCMSDHIFRSTAGPSEPLGTVSFYDDDEPNGNERPYFAFIEKARGKTGIHLERSFLARTFEVADSTNGAYLLPGADSGTIEQERQFDRLMAANGYRSILSGIGGDELLGGIPIPYPELADYIVLCRFGKLFAQATQWSVLQRTTILATLIDTLKFLGSLYISSGQDRTHWPEWIRPGIQEAGIEALSEYAGHTHDKWARPIGLSNAGTWWAILETLPHLYPRLEHRYEYRYPFLDRDLVSFLLRIPAEQLLRPGCRRSLMRRALKDIVPMEILQRPRKAYFSRSLFIALHNEQARIQHLFEASCLEACGLIDVLQFRHILGETRRTGATQWISSLFRTIGFELWLRSSAKCLAIPSISRTNEIMPLFGQASSAQVSLPYS